MDTDFAFIAAAGVALLAGTGSVVWWLQRRRVAELELRLRDAEDSRLELSEDAAQLRQRLEAADRALAAQAVQPPAAAPSLDERRVTVQRLLDGTDAEPRRNGRGWEDTQPMTLPGGAPPFAPTQPAALDTVSEARL